MKSNLTFVLLTSSLLLGACSSSTPNSTTPSNPASSLLEQQANPTGALSRAGWSVRTAPPGVGVQGANLIFDGDPGTFWVTSTAQNNSMALQVDLGSERDFDGIVLESGPNSPNYLRSYNLYVSSDPYSWGPWVAGGEKLTTPKLEAKFPAQKGRYVTLQVGSDLPGKPWNMAEFWLTSSAGGTPTTQTRDPWIWPFSSDSIWNTSIGTGAQYVLPGYFKPGTAHTADTEYYFKLRSSDPLKTLYGVPVWDNRCSDTSQPQRNPDGSLVQVNFPDDFVLDDVTGGSTPNAVTTLLLPDSKTLIGLEPLARCTVGGNVFGYVKNNTGNETLTGTGLYGGHWGSGLSGFGGSIRYGELTGTEPIRHPLKINVPGDYLYFEGNNPETAVNGVVLEGKGFRWPADRNDSGAPGGYKASSAFKSAKMGALLAIPSSVNLSSLGLKTAAAQKMAKALQDYGTYIVDDAGPIVSVAAGGKYNYAQISFSVQREAEGEFNEAFGYDFSQQSIATGPAKEWFDDFGKLVSALAIVENNSPSSVGGPGVRRVTTALPTFGTADTQNPSTPGNLRLLERDTSSVTVAWNPSSDNVKVIRYDVLADNKLLGSSFGKSSLKMGNLQPNTALTLRVQAVDSSLNLSGGSNVVSVSSKDGYVENFENGAAGWALDSAITLEYGQLKMNGWARSPLSVFYPRAFAAPYTLRYATHTDGADDYGKNRLFFNAQDANNGYILEFGGGPQNTVLLKKRVAGLESTLATYAGHYNINGGSANLELSVAAGNITVKAAGDSGNVTLFNAVGDTRFSSGKIGFEQLGTQSFVDNLSLTLE